MQSNSGINYSLISRYRTQLMGGAMIWIIIFHINLPQLPGFLKIIKDFGYGGVDIFLFLSGIGLYTSLSENSSFIMEY